MISVIDVYRTLVDYCNKDQKGFVTPEVFNSFASLAQKKIYNSFFSAVATAKGVRLNQTDGSREFSTNKFIKEDLSRYIKKVRIPSYSLGSQYGYDSPSDGPAPALNTYDIMGSSRFKKPKDLGRIISLSNQHKSLAEIVYNDDDINSILRSNLSRPSVNFPVALIGKDIELFPNDATNGSVSPEIITLSYYRQPRSVYVMGYGEYASGDVDESSEPGYVEKSSAPDPINCRDFDLPEHYKNELVETIAAYIGIRLRDPILQNKSQ
tara:strand:- start:1312 stop:2109 length:798 start_codon:yes stop_codon:yes gene_type:complete